MITMGRAMALAMAFLVCSMGACNDESASDSSNPAPVNEGGGSGPGAAPVSPTITKTLAAPASGAAWTDTGIDVVAGDALTFSASGMVDIGGAYGETTSPDGWAPYTGNTGYPVPDAPRYSLIGAIGSVKFDLEQYGAEGTYFFVGGNASFTALRSGRLWLGVNDHIPWDNAGAYDVTIWRNGALRACRVEGHSGFWVDTGIDLQVGAQVSFTASGAVDIGGAYGEVSGPSGWSPNTGNSGYPLANAARYALIGAIGDVRLDPDQYPSASGYFGIGANRSLTAAFAGRLYLGVNDHIPWDNTGSYTVTVNVTQ